MDVVYSLHIVYNAHIAQAVHFGHIGNILYSVWVVCNVYNAHILDKLYNSYTAHIV